MAREAGRQVEATRDRSDCKGITLDPSSRTSRTTATSASSTPRGAALRRTPRTARRADPDRTPSDSAAEDRRGEIQSRGRRDWWSLRAFRELDDALLQLRVNHLDIGARRCCAPKGERTKVLEVDRRRALEPSGALVLANEILALQARVLKPPRPHQRRASSRSSTRAPFVGTFLELALASDRIYMLEDPDDKVAIGADRANRGALPMSQRPVAPRGTRFLGARPSQVEAARSSTPASDHRRGDRRRARPRDGRRPTTSTGTTSCASRSRSA